MAFSLDRERWLQRLTRLPGSMFATVRTPGARPWLAMLVAGLVVTLLLVILVRRLEEQTAEANFTSIAEARLTLLDTGLGRALDGLLALGGALDGNPALSRAQFAQLARPVLARQPGIRALEWIPLVRPDGLDGLQRAAALEGLAGFQVRELDEHQNLQPVSPRAEHFPVWFIEPMAGNEPALGLDIASSPPRRSALEAARQRGFATVTSRLTLVQDDSRLFAVLMVRPVYAVHPVSTTPGHPADLAPVDPSSLRGFLLAVLRISEVVGDDPEDTTAGRPQLYLFDEDAPAGEQLLHPAMAPYQGVASLPQQFRVQRHLEVGGRRWLAVAQVGAAGLRPDRTGSLVVLVAGLLISLLLARLQFQSLHRTRAIRDTVERRTTELLDSERRLIQLNQEAMQASRAKTVFLASMTHEFRTPMNAILGLLHVLGRSQLDEPQRDHVEKISGAARRLLRLIEDILDVSRIEAGKLSVERHPFQLETVLRDVLVATLPRLRDKPLELLLDLDPAVPAQLVGDGMRLTQVLVNLAENAAKFTQKGEVTLRIRAVTRVERRIDLEFAVSDTGPGLSASEAERLFTPFVQAESSHPRVFGGSGLGLSIARQLVSMMGGDIRVVSAIGQGTTFQFTLPLGVASATPLVTPRATLPPVQVLLLEAHPQAAATLTRLLHAFGAQVRRVAAPDQLPRPFEGTNVDLVLVSQGFPRAQAIQAALGGMPGLRVVELSAAGASLRGLQAGSGVEKPLLPSAVATLLYPALQPGPGNGERVMDPRTGAASSGRADATGPDEGRPPLTPAASPPLAGATPTSLPVAGAPPATGGRPAGAVSPWVGPPGQDPSAAPAPAGVAMAGLAAVTVVMAAAAEVSAQLPPVLLASARHLVTLLRDGDPDAELVARALRREAADGPCADLVDRASALVAQFEYDAALRLLEGLVPPSQPEPAGPTDRLQGS